MLAHFKKTGAVAADDARLDNAREPTSHHASHAAGGSDALDALFAALTAGKIAHSALPALLAGDIPSLVATYQALAGKAAANGYASLDGGTKVPVAQIPDLATSKITGLDAALTAVPVGGQAAIANVSVGAVVLLSDAITAITELRTKLNAALADLRASGLIAT